MQRLITSLLILLGISSVSVAQNNSGALRGVYGPPSSTAGQLGGVYGPSSSAPGALPGVYGASRSGSAILGPVISLPGTIEEGQTLPAGVNSESLPDRPGFGSAMINGHRAIIDQSDNHVVEYDK